MKSTSEKATPTSSSFIPVVNTITAEDRRHYRTTATATATASIILPAVPETSRAYFNFINSIRSPASRKTYEFVIRKYMQYHSLQAVDDLLLLAPIVIEDQIIRWLVSLRENVSYVTRRTYMAAILTFYEINDITLRKRRIVRFLGEETTLRNRDLAYTAEEIRKMLEHADLRSSACASVA
jgi:hypothetical protein